MIGKTLANIERRFHSVDLLNHIGTKNQRYDNFIFLTTRNYVSHFFRRWINYYFSLGAEHVVNELTLSPFYWPVDYYRYTCDIAAP